MLRATLFGLWLVACSGPPGAQGVTDEPDVTEPSPEDTAPPAPDASSGGSQDATSESPSACGKPGECTFSLTGHLIGGGFVISGDDTHALQQQLGAPNIVGATSDDAYTITPGLPGRGAP